MVNLNEGIVIGGPDWKRPHIAVQFVYYTGDGPDPSKRTKELPMGDYQAAGFAVPISPEHAEILQGIFGKIFGVVVQLKDGDRVAATFVSDVGLVPKEIRKEGT